MTEKTKCCDACKPNAYPCNNSRCYCHQIQQQCHQRPDNHECRAGKTCEERPETEWREEFDELWTYGFAKYGEGYEVYNPNGFGDDLKTFISHLLQAAEQRGFERGNFQCKRLYENNQILTKKLRAGNREVLEQVMFEISTLNNPDYDRPWEDALDAVRDRLKTLLAFQQEPHEN